MDPNPYAPLQSLSPGRISWIRALLCFGAMLLTAVAFLYFALVSLMFCYTLLVMPPTTTTNGYFQVALNVVVWGGVACGAGLGFRVALSSLNYPVKRDE